MLQVSTLLFGADDFSVAVMSVQHVADVAYSIVAWKSSCEQVNTILMLFLFLMPCYCLFGQKLMQFVSLCVRCWLIFVSLSLPNQVGRGYVHGDHAQKIV